MYLSKKLITNFFPIFNELEEKKIFEIFNSLGIELESVFKFEKTKKLIVGEIINVKKHENSNNLNICKVKISPKKILTIICGAKNVSKNQKVIVAEIGCKLYDGKEILKKEIRGITSEGMICSYSELTSRNLWMNKNECDDIIVLPSKIEIGFKNPLEIINLDDTIYEISNPSNRNELNSIFGIIYEFQSFLNIKKNINLKKMDSFLKNEIKLKNNILEEYFLIKIKNKNFKNSNWLIKSYLMNSGIVPSNSIEDLAKINQLLTGVPIITFSNIEDENFELIKINKNESVELNNYGNKKLEVGDFVLKNKNKIVCLINIDVTKDFSVNQNSEYIYFLSCKSNTKQIQKTSSRLKIMNDLIKLSIKNISSWWYKKSLEIFIENLKVNFSFIKVNLEFSEIKMNKINFDFNKVNEILGINIKKNEVLSILKSFDYKIDKNFLYPPIYRVDIENDHDVIEDILKVKGIENICEEKIQNSIINLNFNNENDYIKSIINLLTNRGFYLIKSYNLCSKESINQFNFFNYKNPIKILNPISIEREFFKLSLLESILNCYSYNESFKNKLFPIFEIQDIYFNNLKRKHLVISIADNILINPLNKSNIKPDIFTLKTIIETISLLLNEKFHYEKELDEEWSCSKDSLKIFLNKNKIGYITRINPIFLKKYKIKKESIYIAEIDITNIIKKVTQSKYVQNIENKQKIIRELSIICPKDFDLNNFYKLIEKNDIIKNLQIVDKFIKNEKISYSITFEMVCEPNKLKDEFDSIIHFFRINNFKINE